MHVYHMSTVHVCYMPMLVSYEWVLSRVCVLYMCVMHSCTFVWCAICAFLCVSYGCT